MCRIIFTESVCLLVLPGFFLGWRGVSAGPLPPTEISWKVIESFRREYYKGKEYKKKKVVIKRGRGRNHLKLVGSCWI